MEIWWFWNNKLNNSTIVHPKLLSVEKSLLIFINIDITCNQIMHQGYILGIWSNQIKVLHFILTKKYHCTLFKIPLPLFLTFLLTDTTCTSTSNPRFYFMTCVLSQRNVGLKDGQFNKMGSKISILMRKSKKEYYRRCHRYSLVEAWFSSFDAWQASSQGKSCLRKKCLSAWKLGQNRRLTGSSEAQFILFDFSFVCRIENKTFLMSANANNMHR